MALFRYIVVALTIVSFTACTSMQPLEDFSPSKIRKEVDVGDRVSLVYAKVRYDVTVTAVDAEAVHGTTDGGKAYKFPYEGIQAIDVKKMSWGDTAGAAGATVYAAVIVFIIVLLRSLKFGDPSSSRDTGGSGNGD